MASLAPDSIVNNALQIWRRRGGIATGVFLLALAAGLGLIKGLPKLYGATATLVIEKQSNPGYLGRSLTSDDVGKRLQIAEQQVLSRTNLVALIDKFDLYPRLRQLRDDEVLLARARKDIHIDQKEVLRKHGEDQVMVVEVGYQTWRATLAADVANAIASELIAADKQNRYEQASHNTRFLKTQLDDTRDEVTQKEKNIEQFRRKYIGQLPEQQGINLAVLQRLTNELRDNRDAQMKLMEQSGSASDTSSDTNSPSLKDRRAMLEAQYNRLRLNYTDKFPEVVRIKKQLEELNQRIQTGSRDGASDVSAADPESEMDVLRKQEQQLRTRIGKLESSLGSAPLMDYELKQKNQDYEAIRDHYFELMKQYNEANLAQSLEQQPARAFHVLERAIPEIRPRKPNKLHLAILSLMASIGAAGAIVFLLEQVDDSFHSLRSLKNFSTVPVLASVPLVTTRKDSARRFRRSVLAVLGLVIGCVAIAGVSLHFGEGARQLTWMLGRV